MPVTGLLKTCRSTPKPVTACLPVCFSCVHHTLCLRAQEFDKHSLEMREGMDALASLFGSSNGCAPGTGAFLPGAWPHA